MTITYGPIEGPDLRHTLGELRLPLLALGWARSWLALPRRTGPARAVMLIPGFRASDRSLAVLAAHLRRDGHRVVGWGLGRNWGDVRRSFEALRGQVRDLVAREGEPVALVGWSLGGYLAREIARDHPEWIRQVITLGSPVIGGPRYTTAVRWYRAWGWDVDAMEREVAARFATPLTVPVVAIYSKRDGVVAWPACIDRWSLAVRHVEVDATHFTLGFAPQVLDLVAQELMASAAR